MTFFPDCFPLKTVPIDHGINGSRLFKSTTGKHPKDLLFKKPKSRMYQYHLSTRVLTSGHVPGGRLIVFHFGFCARWGVEDWMENKKNLQHLIKR